MEHTNKAAGLLLGLVLGLFWVYTDPNADISATIGKRISVSPALKSHLLPSLSCWDYHSLNDPIYSITSWNKSHAIVGTSQSIQWLEHKNKTFFSISPLLLEPSPIPIMAMEVTGGNSKAAEISIFFCGSKLASNHTTIPGIYRSIGGTIETITKRVPLHSVPKRRAIEVLPLEPKVKIIHLNESNSRPLYSCAALVMSKDEKRIYFVENSAYPTASLSTSTMESISLSPASFIWLYERSSGTVQLVARNFSSVRSLLLEYPDSSLKEKSILLAESTRYQIQRIELEGAEEKKKKVLFSGLHGMPYGLHRDDDGSIWVFLGESRTATLDYLLGIGKLIKKISLRFFDSAWFPSLHTCCPSILHFSSSLDTVLESFQYPLASSMWWQGGTEPFFLSSALNGDVQLCHSTTQE